MILGLACVGLAITAGTYATLGAAVPARVEMTVVKAARKTGRIGGQMAAWINRSVREVIDWTSLSSALRGASITQPRPRCGPRARRSRSKRRGTWCASSATWVGYRPAPERRRRSMD